ncbi:MAG: 4Fe-4S ferredoxin [Deltaproteobacteria bacterium CG_4_10_14_3_um_filter_60_8]|nr:MAG: 4Fe-4S ferredoxin [Desulfobacterales bacterium CG2_30_60_27]PIP44064.1 MAG: 4Fe-4S ferredoxin [Deltaproteobacteria bacterium CG23_combo_of_CG06-09_8_20_14_all_60_8]PIY21318.1 MAG: 4Fe-4S ferredoxin [Deltaproteobacteria bacterium CG_4_10_14_3_um_filter_60_8]
MKMFRKIIEIDEARCDGCGKCILSCAEGALRIVDNKARVIGDRYCDGLGACLGECPRGALRIVEREAEDFDYQAVEALLASQQATGQEHQPSAMANCACASGTVVISPPLTPCQQANRPTSGPAPVDTGSALGHWPVQIRLVPPTAPFLAGADLLVAADCTAFAYPHFHRDLLTGRVVLVGCPKFDDAEAYIQKFTGIFASAGIKTLTLAIMEVPCCGAMRMIVSEAMQRAGRPMDFEEVVIGVRGDLVRRRRQAA